MQLDIATAPLGTQADLVTSVAESIVDEVRECLFEPKPIPRDVQVARPRGADRLSELLRAPLKTTRDAALSKPAISRSASRLLNDCFRRHDAWAATRESDSCADDVQPLTAQAALITRKVY